ncbi:NADP-dependent l-serine l-allo-threonine dehydrogenase [Lasiodiplodia theobromae]|uniref:Putative oxidoreductase n=1 Tax=Lasiodiplodia theobromae TaxID=45133 RepID=A0A5N5CYQ0_9PEZI|nr:NADP-dependent l-serine l-allo-threonine dehydrogenase [Lasiodiplodia theobromae]KAB2570471.1 putative oxidoreductase [Lasiodiplodia theobromae]KAF4542642.1 NADP-dependent l-serine l-allo-threonine dehydrogenase [Lasiodiplodia theobromae]
MSLSGKIILITGASMGIGAAIARRLAQESATLILLSRSADKLHALASSLRADIPHAGPIHVAAADVRQHAQLAAALSTIRAQHLADRPLDALINNAGLALGAPALFPHQSIEHIATMTATNVDGVLFAAHAALNQGGMLDAARGTIVNVTSVTGLEVPPFPGEAVYHATKAAQEAFTNALRNELRETSIRVIAIRPGVVATNFHEQRVGYDKGMYEGFVEGYEPLVADDVAEAVAWVLERPERVAVKALDVVPTAQRSLQVFDRKWNERNGV